MMNKTATASRYPINGFQRGSWGRIPSESRTGEEPVRWRPPRPPLHQLGEKGVIKSTIDAYRVVAFYEIILSFKAFKDLDSCKQSNCLSPFVIAAGNTRFRRRSALNAADKGGTCYDSPSVVVRHFFLLPRVVVGKGLSIFVLSIAKNPRPEIIWNPSPPPYIEDPGETKALYDHSRKCTICRILPLVAIGSQ